MKKSRFPFLLTRYETRMRFFFWCKGNQSRLQISGKDVKTKGGDKETMDRRCRKEQNSLSLLKHLFYYKLG